MAADGDDDKDVNVESGSDMGFGGGVDLGNVNTGGAFDASGGGFGGGLGLTNDVGQAAIGSSVPERGQRSNIGSAVGAVLGLLAGAPGIGAAVGGYAPGAVNSALGIRGSAPEGAVGFGGSAPNAAFGGGSPAPDAANSIAAAGSGAPSSSIGAAGGLLGLGGDKSEADALAQLYQMLKAAGAV